jgi:hypothetical protein
MVVQELLYFVCQLLIIQEQQLVLLQLQQDGTDTILVFNDSGSIHRINMAYFAKLGTGNIVEQVISIN